MAHGQGDPSSVVAGRARLGCIFGGRSALKNAVFWRSLRIALDRLSSKRRIGNKGLKG